MAFTRKNLQPVTGGGSNAPQVFAYLSPDNKATTLASGYFNSATLVLGQGDFILARCSDGALTMSVSSATAAATVTTITTALA
jgi:hypothetical protein